MDATNIKPFREGKLMGLISEKGEVVLPPAYDKIDPFFGCLARVTHEGKQGLIDPNGRLALGELFPKVSVRPWGKKRKYIYIISNGKRKGFILNGTNRFSGFRFDSIGPLCDGRALVSLKHHFGYIDEEGRIVIPSKYLQAENFTRGRAFVVYKKGVKCIDTDGNTLKLEDDPFLTCLRPVPELSYFPTYDNPKDELFIPLRALKFDDRKNWEKYKLLGYDTVFFGRDGYIFYFYNTKTMLKEIWGVVDIQMVTHDTFLTFASILPEGYEKSINTVGVRNTFGEEILPEVFNDVSYESSGKFRVSMPNWSGYILPSGVFVHNKKSR